MRPDATCRYVMSKIDTHKVLVLSILNKKVVCLALAGSDAISIPATSMLIGLQNELKRLTA